MQEIPSLRVVFAGTPPFAADHLQALLDSQHDVVAVYTQPDRRAGRGKKLLPGPVKQLAVDHGIPVYQPASLKSPEEQSRLEALKADVMIVVAYGLILPEAVLGIPAYGCINVHASLLPRWRGAAPVQRAIEAGDSRTGVTLMQMDTGLDTGDMLASAACDIDANETTASLLTKLTDLGRRLLLDVLDTLPKQELTPIPQDEKAATYAPKIEKSEAAIDWNQDAATIERRVRAFNPFPITYTEMDGQRIKIHRASVVDQAVDDPPGTLVAITDRGLVVACGEGCLCLEEIQLPGKKAMPTHALLRGHADRFAVSQRFTAGPATS